MVLTLDLRPELEERLRRQAERRGIPAEEFAVQVLEENVSQAASAPAVDSVGHRLLELAESARAGVPAEEWEKLPTDHAKNYKHYLYGHPKHEE